MIKITGELLKQCITRELLSLAPDVNVYKETVSKPSYPYFYIYQVSMNYTKERKDRYNAYYSFDIYYRNKSDSSTDDTLNTNLDKMALTLMEGFNLIKCGDSYIRCTNKRTEKVEGVLNFLFEIKIPVQKIDEGPHVKQNTLTIQKELII